MPGSIGTGLGHAIGRRLGFSAVPQKTHPPIGRGSTLLQPQLFYDCLMTSICLEPNIQTTNEKQTKNKQITRLKRHNLDLKQQKVVCLLRV